MRFFGKSRELPRDRVSTGRRWPERAGCQLAYKCGVAGYRAMAGAVPVHLLLVASLVSLYLDLYCPI